MVEVTGSGTIFENPYEPELVVVPGENASEVAGVPGPVTDVEVLIIVLV